MFNEFRLDKQFYSCKASKLFTQLFKMSLLVLFEPVKSTPVELTKQNLLEILPRSFGTTIALQSNDSGFVTMVEGESVVVVCRKCTPEQSIFVKSSSYPFDTP